MIFLLLINLIVCFAFSEEDLTNQEINQILEMNKQMLNEAQSNILGLNNLPGTCWVIDDYKTNPFSEETSPAFLFLNDNSVIIITIGYKLSDGKPNGVYYIMSIGPVTKYKIEDDKIIILDRLDGYLKDTFLYFGNTTYGYMKYHLEFIFPIID
jgi:hypothetical protein